MHVAEEGGYCDFLARQARYGFEYTKDYPASPRLAIAAASDRGGADTFVNLALSSLRAAEVPLLHAAQPRHCRERHQAARPTLLIASRVHGAELLLPRTQLC